MRWFGRRTEMRTREGSAAGQAAVEMFETLEDRLVLYQGPMISGLPPITSLENPYDTVVRMDTNMGPIDIELFDQLVPSAVAAFKGFVNSGRFDDSFFHSMTPGLLYGGRAKFTDAGGLSAIPVTANDLSPNGLSRSNLQGTLSLMPVDSTHVRNIFVINLTNNTSLNTQNGGFPVFAKVVQGWNVVQAIAGLNTVDLNNDPKFNTPGGPYNRVPVTGAYNPGVGATEATLVKVIDIEVVKPYGSNRPFGQTLVFPEGFRSATTTESIGMVNLDSNANFYQIIVRYETGDRDNVILTGVMQAGARLTLKINDAASPTYNIVRSGVGYAFEIRTTAAFTAQLNHRDSANAVPHMDNGILIDQSFQVLARLFPGQLQTWNLAGGEKGALLRSYVLFQNLTDQAATLNITLTNDNGTAKVIQVGLQPDRRGGISVGDLMDFPDGHYSVNITANKPIVASLSQYKLGGMSNLSEADSALGTINGGSTEGYLAAAQVPSTGTSQFDMYYTATNIGAVTVNFQFVLTNGTVLPGQVLLTAAQRRKTMTLSAINPSLPTDQYFSVYYTVNNGVTPVTVSYQAELAGDLMSTPFQTVSAHDVAFADGYTDPTMNASQMSEKISIFNPYASSAGLFDYRYDLVFHFNDSDPYQRTIWASNPDAPGEHNTSPSPGFSLGAHQRIDVSPMDFQWVAAKIASNPSFRFYSVEIIAFPLSFSNPNLVGGVVASMTRVHNQWGMNLTTIPSLSPAANLVFLNSPEFH